MRFKCASCEEWHEGVPGFGRDAPLYYYGIPIDDRAARCELTADTCVIDGKSFYARGCIEIPVEGESEPFIWGVWVSLSLSNFEIFKGSLGIAARSHLGPFFGWLDDYFEVYPATEPLKTMLRLRDNGERPLIVLEPTDYPLAVEQRSGISVARVAEIYSVYLHGRSPAFD